LSGSDKHRRWVLRWHRAARRAVEAPAGARTPLQIRRSDAVPAIVCQAISHRLWLWWPCEACGGTKLPLRERARLDLSDHARRLQSAATGDQPCPGCETVRRRLELAGAEPAVWYDVSLGDWVVRVPCGGPCDAAQLPLEIRWFDASWAEVYRAASDIVHAHERVRRRPRGHGPGNSGHTPGLTGLSACSHRGPGRYEHGMGRLSSARSG
jgi:hypothetical protein